MQSVRALTVTRSLCARDAAGIDKGGSAPVLSPGEWVCSPRGRFLLGRREGAAGHQSQHPKVLPVGRGGSRRTLSGPEPVEWVQTNGAHPAPPHPWDCCWLFKGGLCCSGASPGDLQLGDEGGGRTVPAWSRVHPQCCNVCSRDMLIRAAFWGRTHISLFK